MVPLLRAAWIRPQQSFFFSLCLTEHPFQTQNLSIFHATQRAGLSDASPPSRLQEMSFPCGSTSLPRAALVPLLDGIPACVAHDFCNPEDPDAIGDDSSFFAVTQQQWRACILPPSSLGPRLASGAFAVAKDEGRDRFIRDRRPLNSSERSIGRAHLPCCPRLRWLILGKSETVQITVRDTKDCFYLYEAFAC